MDEALPTSGWRGSPELWLAAAHDLLLESGVDAVRILPLAKALKLSRTSFYWFFKDREELLSALVARWREKNTGGLVGRTQAPAATIAEAMLNVFDCWLDRDLFDSAFEFAIRSWALQSPAILAEVRDADRQRLAALAAMFRRFGYDETAADVRARTVYLVQIGYISMQSQEALGVRMRRIPDYVEVFTDHPAESHELGRFHARHGFGADAPDTPSQSDHAAKSS